jgi:hypothetical protein
MTQITHTLHEQLAALKGKVKVKNRSSSRSAQSQDMAQA